jgi:hypothetical protein
MLGPGPLTDFEKKHKNQKCLKQLGTKVGKITTLKIQQFSQTTDFGFENVANGRP